MCVASFTRLFRAVFSADTDLHKHVPPKTVVPMALIWQCFFITQELARVYCGCPVLNNFLSIIFSIIVDDSSL